MLEANFSEKGKRRGAGPGSKGKTSRESCASWAEGLHFRHSGHHYLSVASKCLRLRVKIEKLKSHAEMRDLDFHLIVLSGNFQIPSRPCCQTWAQRRDQNLEESQL